MLFLADLAMLFLGLLVVILPTAILIFIIYKLIKKLSHDHIEYQYRYQQYKEAEAEIDEIAADIRMHQEGDR